MGLRRLTRTPWGLTCANGSPAWPRMVTVRELEFWRNRSGKLPALRATVRPGAGCSGEVMNAVLAPRGGRYSTMPLALTGREPKRNGIVNRARGVGWPLVRAEAGAAWITGTRWSYQAQAGRRETSRQRGAAPANAAGGIRASPDGAMECQ